MKKETAVKLLHRLEGRTFHQMEMWNLTQGPSWSAKYHLKLKDAKIEDSCGVWGSITMSQPVKPERVFKRTIWVEKSVASKWGKLLHRASKKYKWEWDMGQICGNCHQAAIKFLRDYYGM